MITEAIPLEIPPRIVTPGSLNRAARTVPPVTLSCAVLVDDRLWGRLHVNFFPGTLDWRLDAEIPPVRLGALEAGDLPAAIATASREVRRRLEFRLRRPLRDAVWMLIPSGLGEAAAKPVRNEPPVPASAVHPCVRRALRFAEDHAGEPITIGQVASLVNVSDQYFCRIFRECTGVPFMQHLAALRVSRAQSLLAESSGSVKQIAFTVGFGSIAQFNRVFKKQCGISPSEYRAGRDRGQERREPFPRSVTGAFSTEGSR